MTIAKDLAQLGKLIAAHHGWPAAKAFKAYLLSDADRAVLSGCAVDLLRLFPTAASPAELTKASGLMSAALAVQLESRLDAPVHVVAGTLSVEGVPVLGDRRDLDGAALFSSDAPDGSETDWSGPKFNGHIWVMVGPAIVDIGLFRAAYSPHGPARLARHIDLIFGPNKALYVDHWKRSGQQGLSYEPQYVLSADEVTRLMGGAFHAINAQQAQNRA